MEVDLYNTSMAENVTTVNPLKIPFCINKIVLFQKGTLSYVVGRYIFPLVFVVGFTGNLLNLIVLTSRGMRTKANCFLSAMAISDLCFLFVMFVLNLAVYDDLTSRDGFLTFYFVTKIPLSAMANGFSSSSIWFAVVVTAERLVAIRTPFHARSFWKTWRISVIIGSILTFSFVLQSYNFFWLTPQTAPHCVDVNRRMYYFKQLREHHNYYLFHYVRISLIVTPLIQVTFPLLLLILLNAILLRALWMNRNSISKLGQSSTQNDTRNKELKITMTVLTIVVTFLIFNFPSVVMYWLTTTNLLIRNAPAVVDSTFVINFMVVINKALNFLLYCMSSANFRRRLVRLFKPHANVQFHSITSQDETKFTLDAGTGCNLANRSTKRKYTLENDGEKIELYTLMNQRSSSPFYCNGTQH